MHLFFRTNVINAPANIKQEPIETSQSPENKIEQSATLVNSSNEGLVNENSLAVVKTEPNRSIHRNEPEPSTSYELYSEPEAGPSGITQEIRRNLTAYHNNRRSRHLSTSSDDDDDDGYEIKDERQRILDYSHQRLMEPSPLLSPPRSRMRALSGSNVRLLSSDELTNNSNMELLTAPDLQLDWLSDSTDQSIDELVCTRNASDNSQSSAKVKNEPPLHIDLTNEPDDDPPFDTNNRNTSSEHTNQSPMRRLRHGLYGDSYPHNASSSNRNIDSSRSLNQNTHPSHYEN